MSHEGEGTVLCVSVKVSGGGGGQRRGVCFSPGAGRGEGRGQHSCT